MFKVNQKVYLVPSCSEDGEGYRYQKRYGKGADIKTAFLFMGYMDGDSTQCVVVNPKGKVLWGEPVDNFQDTMELFSWEKETFGYG